jgi:hypothetical protein
LRSGDEQAAIQAEPDPGRENVSLADFGRVQSWLAKPK